MAIEAEVTTDPYGEIDSDEGPCTPNPTQKKVLEWWDRARTGKHKGGGIPTLYLQGGVGCGKTRAFLAVVMEALIEISGVRVMWGRQDFNDLRLSAMETFLDMMPQELIISQNIQEHRYRIKQTEGKGGQIFFRGLKDVKGLGSQEFSIIVVTEAHEITHNCYRALKRRCRQKSGINCILMESNPPNEGDWLAEITNEESEMYDPTVEKWEVSTYENWDNLPTAYKQDLELMPDSWKRNYLYGKTGFIPDGTPVFAGYREEIHGGEFKGIPGRTVYVGWDFGYHYPAILCSQIDDVGRWLILREYMGKDMTVDQFCDIVTVKLNQWFPNLNFQHFGDPAGDHETDKDAKVSIETCRDKGFEIQTKHSNIRPGLELIQRKIDMHPGGKPMFRVHKACRIFNRALLGGYHWPERKTGKSADTKPVKDGYYEHLCDCARYKAIHLFQLRTPETSKERLKRENKEREHVKKASLRNQFGA